MEMQNPEKVEFAKTIYSLNREPLNEMNTIQNVQISDIHVAQYNGPSVSAGWFFNGLKRPQRMPRGGTHNST